MTEATEETLPAPVEALAATEETIRPAGTWVVAGFLVFATVTIWLLVSVIFNARS